jgi:hypothetical protein
VIDQWKSRISFSLAPTSPALARACRPCASFSQNAPSSTAETGYSQLVCASGHRASETATITQE